jgi:uncharacterized membrane protein
MLGSNDPHRFRKTVAGACMVLSPALGLVGFIVAPGYHSGAGSQLATVAAHRDQWFISELLILLSLVAFVPAVLGLMHMLREREVASGHLGGALGLVGIMAAVGSTAIGMVMWQMTATPAMAALVNRVQDTTGTFVLFFLGVFCLTAGMVVLCAGLWRAHATHPIATGLVALGSVVAAVGFAANEQWLLIASYAMLLAGLGAIGQMVLNETVEDWEHTPSVAAGAH